MSYHHANLTDDQARAWVDGTLRLVLVPMRPQPYLHETYTREREWWVDGPNGPVPEERFGDLCPYRPGEPIALRETWGYTPDPDPLPTVEVYEIAFKADDPDVQTIGGWQSPALLPIIHARIPWPTLERCYPAPLSEFTTGNMYSTGLSSLMYVDGNPHLISWDYDLWVSQWNKHQTFAWSPDLWCWWLWLVDNR